MSWLTPVKDAVLNDGILRTVRIIDPFFQNEPSLITSGVRTEADQMRIICEKVHRHGLKGKYFEWAMFTGNEPSVKTNINGGGQVYWWQRTWSDLLEIGNIVNPPLPAVCLSNYVRPDGKAMKGVEIGISSHQRGVAFDIGGGMNLKNKEQRLLEAIKTVKLCYILNYRTEKVNNALHVSIFSS